MPNYAIIEDGIVVNIVVWDGGTTWSPPDGQTAIAIEDGVEVGIGYSVVDGKFVAPIVAAPTHEELVAEAGRQKTQTLLSISDVTQLWQTQLALGIITDTDKDSLILWMKYAQEVQAVDTSSVPDIEWPVAP